jgi:hypothetical protein
MAKSDAERENPETVPTKFAETTPSSGPDLMMWLLNAMHKNTEMLGKLDGTVASFQAQIDRMEGKVDAIHDEVKGHGKWIHTLKFALLGVGILIGWAVVYGIGPWVTKFFSGK